jgi:fructose-bisphosphate aldolase class II
MTIARTSDLVSDARGRRAGVVAFNVITLEHVEAVVAAAASRATAVILQISQNAVRYHAGKLGAIALAGAAVAEQAGVPISIHLDHVTDDSLLAEALDSLPRSGISSVMYDAGALPYEENVARTRRAARLAHAAGLWVEAELGYVGGKPDSPQSAHAEGVRTDPHEAERFVSDTGVDGLAVAVGSSHAMAVRTARLDHDLIARLQAQVPVPLVLHGSSGVAFDELRLAVESGITKVNVGTALNVALTRSIRDLLEADPLLVDPRLYLGPARDAMSVVAQELLDGLNGRTTD